jgi:uncharacterized protein YndB with AHSA1/START domain
VIYQAFAEPKAMERWLPPTNMSGHMLAFDFREGGFYRMRLTYNEPHHAPGKSSEDSDEVEVQILKLIANERIEQAVTFDAEDPAFAGVMKITWTFTAVPEGTEVRVRCDHVPPGIRPEDHEAGLRSSLANLAVFTASGSSG